MLPAGRNTLGQGLLGQRLGGRADVELVGDEARVTRLPAFIARIRRRADLPTFPGSLVVGLEFYLADNGPVRRAAAERTPCIPSAAACSVTVRVLCLSLCMLKFGGSGVCGRSVKEV